ncbi:hypothetical protein Rsub_07952 [Raphidocelis subcapitata]|uniref:Nudix hydrolase domain-containing protein n=1 Tax=Raphidocelis subcapitata TaxID=307507 RepID=A0A2V0PDJ1_9CHLO|nr:hypothetical protein Rsub_07952 [Raphidocelis subcapitata]|eukprot:GBF95237.1 hypothetical protein Rsub_07952 [Raphidocelis subcapitata]
MNARSNWVQWALNFHFKQDKKYYRGGQCGQVQCSRSEPGRHSWPRARANRRAVMRQAYSSAVPWPSRAVWRHRLRRRLGSATVNAMEGAGAAAAVPRSPPAAPSVAVAAGWRPVVTAFVQRDDGRVLLVRRSDRVSTYRGMWGGVSGGVEAGDASLPDRAFQEIEEEVGIPRARLRLVCCGRPQPVRDRGRRFLVHPMLMAVAGGGGDGGPAAALSSGGGGGGAAGEVGLDALAPAASPAVALNWENTEARWVLPAELPSLPHVPLLQETLRRLVLPPYMRAHVEHLAQDRAHGAAELAAYAVQAFGAVAAHELRGSQDDRAELAAQQPCWQAVSEAYHNFAWHMACARPSMAAVANAAAGVMAALHSELKGRADAFGPDEQTVRVALLEAVRAESARLAARGAALQGHIEALLSARPGAVVLTTSYSSTLLAALTAPAARAALGGVVCCEARPLCEGVAFARALAAAGVPRVTVITDAQSAAFVRSAGLVLLGADALGPQGAVNKVGSLAIALAAREARVPVFACGDSGKVGIGAPVTALVSLGGGGERQQPEGDEEEKGAEEVVAGWPSQLRGPAAAAGPAGAEAPMPAPGGGAPGGGAPGGGAPGVGVRNVYFETVPLALLTGGVVTEAGLAAAGEIEAAAAAQRAALLEAFELATLAHPPPADE